MKDRGKGSILGAKPSFTERMLGSFSFKRGLKGFGLGLLVSPVIILIKSLSAEEFQWDGVPFVMLIIASLCGVWGLFSKKDLPV
ncbi:hypothetical protein [Erythrobacter sp. THAF29]|uniref:hypothetical protein n=1 Tax=Erythrobacter sp. THAF29 TaxID=2587851 RepID=UPI001267ED78|nr:hypothetical protein [Erythrobacter sp. THAF29]QFT78174.1 hypothetical protein FIU90_11550 [Erythrobacter sp. THAF29]